MNHPIKEELCRLIQTISPSEKTANNLRNEFSTIGADHLLDLLKSPTIFRYLNQDDIIFDEVAKRVFAFCRDPFIRECYDALFDFYLDEILEKIQTEPADFFSKLIIFEINHRNQLIEYYDDPVKTTDIENDYLIKSPAFYQQAVEELQIFLENYENLEANFPRVRILFETLLLLNSQLLQEPAFINLILNRRGEFTAAFGN